MLSISLPDESIIKKVLKEDKNYLINKEAGKYVTAYGHYNFSYFDVFRVIEIGKYSVEVIFKNESTNEAYTARITNLFIAKYLENCFTNPSN